MKIATMKIENEFQRKSAINIMKTVFMDEKKWINYPDKHIPKETINSPQYSWFIAYFDEIPVGLLRLLYDPPLELPKNYQATLNKDINIAELQRSGRFVEVGRFMILKEYRKNFRIALSLMKSSIKEVIERDYTHLITDVFEGEETSPYNFHTRVLGFKEIGSHLHGELECPNRRIILTMNIYESYLSLKKKGGKIYDYIKDEIENIIISKIRKKNKRITQIATI